MGKATENISLKTIAFKFPNDSVHRVYLHGKWQQGRGKGRKPTLLFGNHTDPREAFASAQEMVGDYWDDLQRIHCCRSRWFWDDNVVSMIMNHVPVGEIVQELNLRFTR